MSFNKTIAIAAVTFGFIAVGITSALVMLFAVEYTLLSVASFFAGIAVLSGAVKFADYIDPVTSD